MLRRVGKGGDGKGVGREGEEQWRCASLDEYYMVFYFFPRNQWIKPPPPPPYTLLEYLFKGPVNRYNKVSFITVYLGNSAQGKLYLLCPIKNRQSMWFKLPHNYLPLLLLLRPPLPLPPLPFHLTTSALWQQAICNVLLNPKAHLLSARLQTEETSSAPNRGGPPMSASPD